jgi:hypothetical protein
MESQTKLWTSTKNIWWIIVEWAATVVLIIGVVLTALNIFPLNIYYSVVGNLLWLLVAFHWKKMSLVAVEIVILLIYIAGMYKHHFM